MSSSLIHINLSSENEAKKNKRPQQTKLSNAIGITVAVLLFCVAVFYVYASLKNQKTRRLKNSYKSIEKKYNEAVKMQKLYDKLSDKYKTLNEFKKSRLHLSEKWLELAKITPKDIYITDINVKPVDVNANSFNMIIKARAVNTVDESLVLKYLDNIKECSVFTNTFKTITLSAVYSDNNEKVFSIEMSQTGEKQK